MLTLLLSLFYFNCLFIYLFNFAKLICLYDVWADNFVIIIGKGQSVIPLASICLDRKYDS